MTATKSRLFFAVWPDAPVRTAIAEAGKDASLDKGRRIRPENLHLTLLFIGAVDQTLREKLLHTGSLISVPKFSLQLDHSGWWRPARVAWVAPVHVPPELQLLHDRLQELARVNGLLPELRPYRPHVTLAKRITTAATPQFETITWPVTEYCLAESIPHSGYVEYRIIGHWPLT